MKKAIGKMTPKVLGQTCPPTPPGLVYTQRTVVLFRLDGLQLPEGGASGQRPRFLKYPSYIKRS